MQEGTFMTTRHTISAACVLGVLSFGQAAGADELADDFVPLTSITASSVLPGKNDRYAASRALDERTDTAWCEGAADEGIGATLTIAFETPADIDEVMLEPGMRGSAKLFAANNRPTRLEVQADGGPVVAVTSKGQDKPVARLAAKAVKQLTIRIAAVEKGAMNDSCISEVTLRRSGEVKTPVLGTTRAALRAFPKAMGELARALETCDVAGLAKTVQFPLSYVQGVEGVDSPSRKYIYRDAASLAKGCKRNEAPGSDTATENVTKNLEELFARRTRLDELVLEVYPGWEIGQTWHLRWSDKRGWLLIAAD
jgi:hypothetical protein